jgi:hypothetical protein
MRCVAGDRRAALPGLVVRHGQRLGRLRLFQAKRRSLCRQHRRLGTRPWAKGPSSPSPPERLAGTAYQASGLWARARRDLRLFRSSRPRR